MAEKKQIVKLDHDPIEHLNTENQSVLLRHQKAGGCFNIIPLVAICWEVNGTNIEICLKLGGIEVACATIDPSNPCVKVEGSLVLVKASVEVCFKNDCLTYDAKLCVRECPWCEWNCWSEEGKIICF